MKERFDEKSGDLYVWITHEEFEKEDTGIPGPIIGRLVNQSKNIVVILSRTPNGVQANTYIEVLVNDNEDGGKTWTNFAINLSPDSWEELGRRKWTRDRYGLGQKVTVLIGDPKVEGLDAIY